MRRLYGLIALGSIGLGLIGCANKGPGEMDVRARSTPFSSFDKDASVEPGYVNPRGIELMVRDLDLNGKVEPVLNYSGQDYLMKYDSAKNKVELVPYNRKIDIVTK